MIFNIIMVALFFSCLPTFIPIQPCCERLKLVNCDCTISLLLYSPIVSTDELVAPAEQGVLNGYYYYFYPIKSFLNQTDDDHTMANSSQDMMMMMMSDAGMMDGNKDMMVDPLFLATAGFVTMATLISVGILFLPKFGSDRSWKKAALKNIPEEEDDMFSLTRVIGQAIQGKDCAERLACELGRTIRNMKLGQKPLR